MKDSDQTIAQMQAAPKDAYYVWGGDPSMLGYARDMAKRLGRSDLTIVDAAFFSYRERKGKKKLRLKIIIDHDCVLSVSQAAAIKNCNLLDTQ